MHLTKRIKLQLIAFAVIGIIVMSIMAFQYMQVPSEFFGIGRYTVTMEMPRAAGLYEGGNVTYRGVEVGRVASVRLTDTGAQAVLSLKSTVKIPADLDAQVHSVSAVGEQYIELLPRSGNGAQLKDRDVIPLARTSIPPDIGSLLDATNRGLQAIPPDNLRTVVDESYKAVGGLGPELSRLVKGSTALATKARQNLDPMIALIENSQPVLDSQSQTSGSIQAWASHLADVTSQLRTHDDSVRGLLQNGGPAAEESRQLLDRVHLTLPVILANLVSLGQVAVTYRPNIEQLLVLIPELTAEIQAIQVANADTKQSYKGAFLSFNLNINYPPPCTTGFLPAQQHRAETFEDYPDPPPGDVYCRVPQDSSIAVRGARNYPCETVPGKRAATVKQCESNQDYVPLNDGWNWKGDPNATLSGQAIPQPEPVRGAQTNQPSPSGLAPPPIATVHYDPATGMFMAPDGRMYTQSDLGPAENKEKTWQSMLLPPTGG